MAHINKAKSENDSSHVECESHHKQRQKIACSSIRRSNIDVLCGRGIPIQNYHGNIRMHSIIDKYRELYLSTQRKSKPAFIKRVLAEIQEGGARFLKRSEEDNVDDPWQEMDSIYAYEKVSHALRCRKPVQQDYPVSSRSAPPLVIATSGGSGESAFVSALLSGTENGVASLPNLAIPPSTSAVMVVDPLALALQQWLVQQNNQQLALLGAQHSGEQLNLDQQLQLLANLGSQLPGPSLAPQIVASLSLEQNGPCLDQQELASLALFSQISGGTSQAINATNLLQNFR